MRHSARTRLIVSIALIISGLGVTFAAADSLINTREADKSHSSSSVGQIAGATGAEPEATSDVLGARASSEEPRADRDRAQPRSCNDDRRCEGSWGDAERSGQAIAAALVLASDEQEQNSAPGDVDQITQLIPRVRERVQELLPLRECTSAIGGKAICLDFSGGNYFVGDAPDDGRMEIGFCTSDGYYYVATPSLAGGTGTPCPGETAGDDKATGNKAPKARECTSSVGGEATCFDFADGKYLVIDSKDDGESELGFCTGSGYYYVAGPSVDGGTNDECPDSAA
jgi:hypothetical protein